MEQQTSTFGKWYSVYLGLFIFTLLLQPKLAALFFIMFVPLAVIGFKKKFLQFKINPFTLLFVVLYLLYAFYCLFTRNSDLANKYLEYKLSFVVFPILFLFVPRQKLSVEIPVIGVLLATCVLFVAGLSSSISLFLERNRDVDYLFASYFSNIHHPSYASVYFTVALFLGFYAYRMQFKWMSLWLLLVLTFVNCLGIIFCMSLAGILFFMLACGFVVLYWIYRKWGKGIAFTFLLVLPMVLITLVTFTPQLNSEWQNAKQNADEYLADSDAFIRNKKYPMSGSEVRLVMWTASAKVFADYPMGVGTGNVDEVLTAYLNRLDQTELAKQNYNPHNQFIQTGIEIGIFGCLILILILILALRIGIKHRNWLLILCVGNLFFNMLFESMLQRQSGILFFVMGFCLLTVFSENSVFPALPLKSRKHS